jgi:3,4-dihydroxy 2-butanone 4-phosphate synthase/GTP cyclohydrolase II
MVITTSTILKLKTGDFKVSYHVTSHGEILSFSLGDLKNSVPIVRLHSACLFGEAFYSKHCDCYEQLHKSLKIIKKHGSGVVIYGSQEGRGIGMEQKIKAMELQRVENLDTVDAFKKLGFPPDLRKYDSMIQALNDLEINKEIILVSNNPNKERALKDAGFNIKQMINIEIKLTKHNKHERLTKKNKMGYYID